MGGEVTCASVREELHSAILKMRSLERMLESKEFEIAFKKATDEQVKTLQSMLKAQSVLAVRRWIRDLIEEPLGLRSYRALRDLAKNENVPRYSRLNRDQLIRALEKKRDL